MMTWREANVKNFPRQSDGKAYGFGGTDVVKKGGEVIGEFLEGVFFRFVRFVGLTVTQHVRCNDTIAGFNPRADLVFPGSPNRPRTMNKPISLIGKQGAPEVWEPVNQEKSDSLVSIVVGR